MLQEFHQSWAFRNPMECQSQLEWYYLEDMEIPSEKFDILNWWKVNSTKYPIVTQITSVVLAIFITTIA